MKKSLAKIIKPYLPTVLHTLEALAVLGVAYGVSRVFPEHAIASGIVAFGALSAFAKGVRDSDVIKVPDYVNPDLKKR